MDPLKIFISYSHQDAHWLEHLEASLTPITGSSGLSVWWDGKIKTSQKWRAEIDSALASADLAVLLVSRHFLASQFIADNELPYLLKSAEERGLKICWILVGNCLFQRTPISEYQAAHDVSRPLNKLSEGELDDVLVEIAQNLNRTAFEFRVGRLRDILVSKLATLSDEQKDSVNKALQMLNDPNSTLSEEVKEKARAALCTFLGLDQEAIRWVLKEQQFVL